ncbi:helix-hairpin-helix domain-containing protein [Candidatus Margulisiibacteriota bacterium]
MFSKEQTKIFIYIIIILIIGTVVTIYRTRFRPISSDYIKEGARPPIVAGHIKDLAASVNVLPKAATELIIVHIAGAVKNPGVYNLRKGIRGLDAVRIAGGILPEANLDKVNLAVKLKDGKRLFIPFQKKRKHRLKKPKKTKQSSQKINSASINNPININSATQAELVLIPGIGPSTAKRILEERNNSGGFKSIEDLLKVKGIGAKKIEKIKPYIQF